MKHKAARILALLLLLLLAVVPVQAVEARAPVLYFATEDGASQLPLGGPGGSGNPNPFHSGEPIGDVVFDAKNELAWIASATKLYSYSLKHGLTTVGTFASEPVVQLALVQDTGQVWLAYRNRLRAFDVDGNELFDSWMPFPLVSLSIDQAQGQLWVGSTWRVEARDATSGNVMSSLALAPGTVVRHAEVDPATSTLWVAADSGILLFDQEGGLRFSNPNPVVDRLVSLGAGPDTVMAGMVGPNLYLFGSDGRPQSSLQPFGIDRNLVDLLADPGSYSVWVTDGVGLVRVNWLGSIETTRPIYPSPSPSAPAVTALAQWPGTQDGSRPTISFAQPTAPGSSLLFSDNYSDSVEFDVQEAVTVELQAGIDFSSLEVAVDGVPIEAFCGHEGNRIRCQLPMLEEGLRVLSARISDLAGNVSATVQLTAFAEHLSDTPTGPTYTPIASPRGQRPNVPFVAAGGFDSVDPNSGNLTLRIPIGQTYEVGQLSYQLQVVYNSNVWNHYNLCDFFHPAVCQNRDDPRTMAMPSASNNAGLGWELHLGKLYAPQIPLGLPDIERSRWPNRPEGLPPNNKRWIYVAPDGAVHRLLDVTGWGDGNQRFSTDGSHLRLDLSTLNQAVVQYPDGSYSRFEKVEDTPLGNDFCGNGVSGCHRLRETCDATGENCLIVGYGRDPSQETETWYLHDGSRQHEIIFRVDASSRGGGDGVHPLYTTNAFYPDEYDEWGDLRRVVEEVKLETFGDGTSSWYFGYDIRTIARGCPNDIDDAATNLGIPILDRIAPPTGERWKIVTNAPDDAPPDAGCRPTSGLVEEVEYPSQGKVAWAYDVWDFPTRCTFHNQSGSVDVVYGKHGVSARILKSKGGSEEGRRTFDSDLYSDSGLVDSGPLCTRHTWRESTVVEPDAGGRHLRKIFYSSTAQGPFDPQKGSNALEDQVSDNGLPFTKEHATSSNPTQALFLSSKTQECTSGCSDKITRWVRYMSEWAAASGCKKQYGSELSCFKRNPVLVSEEVRHTGGGTVFTDFSSYNGLGGFRVTEIDGSGFDHGGAAYRKTTNYDVTGASFDDGNGDGYYEFDGGELPSRWILGTYDQIKTELGGKTHISEFEFDDDGLLECRRDRRSATGGGRSNKDVAVVLERNAAGLITKETVSGGDAASLPVGAVCAIDAGSPDDGRRFEIRHEYEHKTLSRTYLQGYPNWYEADVDQNTGLPEATYNVAGQKTSLEYDELSRPTLIRPRSGLNTRCTVFDYRNDAGQDPFVIEVWKANNDGTCGSELGRQQTDYDHHGRLKSEKRQVPDGGADTVERKKSWTYYVTGQVKTETSWGSTSRKTSFSQYDVYGRPRETTRPDGSTVSLISGGANYVDREVDVATSNNSQSEATYRSYFDPLGRTTFEHNAKYDTEYTLDPKGNVLEAERIEVCSAGPCPSQSRDYTYDGRGFMTRERLPEIGTGGNGNVDYELDAIGQVRRKTDPEWDLSYLYDNGGRLIRIQEGGGRIWKQWVWGTSNSGDDFRLGKVTKAIRHNHMLAYNPADPGNRLPYDAAWEERYEYRGKGGAISEVKSQLAFDGTTAAGFAFAQEYAYDAFGNRITLEYPRCIAPLHLPEDDPSSCNDGDDVEAPAHVATTVVNRGTPWRVISSRGPEIEHYFHSNRQISKREYKHDGNLFLRGTVTKDPWNMSRPRAYSYRAIPDTGSLFATGTYTYDDSGNVWKIGTDRYHYDKANRLLKGTVKKHSPGASEEVRYDFADNVVNLRHDGGPWLPGPISSSTNHYEGTHTYDGAGNNIEILGNGETLFAMDYGPFGQMREFWSFWPELPGQPRDHDYLVESVYGPGDYRVFTSSINVEPDVGYEAIRTLHLRDLDGKVLQQYQVEGLGSQAPDVFVHEKDYLYGPDGRAFAVQAHGGLPTEYLAADHLGTVRLITNHQGVVLGRHDYYPFGKETYRENQADDRMHKFTGHERDYSSLTDYMLGRTYLYPEMRFASPDPGRDGWNLYAYTRNNPVNLVDPDGEAAVAVVVGGGVLATSAVVWAISPSPVYPDQTNFQALFTSLGEATREAGRVVNDILHSEKEEPKKDSSSPPESTDTKETEKARKAVKESAGRGHANKGSVTGSNRPKHEMGDARRHRDRGGEKADARRRLPRKRPPGWKGPWPPKG